MAVVCNRLDGADDARVELYRRISDRELIRERGVFVAEGRLVVRRVIEDGRLRVVSLLVNEAARRELQDVLERLPSDVPIYTCDTSAFLEMTGYNIHRGCLALVERPRDVAVEALLAAARTIVVLEAVANADNVGGVLRSAAALGADGVILSPTCCDPFYRKAVRTSMGAVLQMPTVRASEWPSVLARARAAGFTIAALTPREPSETLASFAARPRPPKIALLVGAEGAGLSADAEAAADVRIRIPMTRSIDSLNVVVAAGIALHSLRTLERENTT